MLFHLLEYMYVDFSININKIQKRWEEFGSWSQLVLKHVDEEVQLITKAPKSGIWQLQENGSIEFIRDSIDWSNIGDESYAFYLRIYGEGDYSYQGADMGILVSCGRMQSDDRELLPRAKEWITAINSKFSFKSLDSSEAPLIPSESIRKMI